MSPLGNRMLMRDVHTPCEGVPTITSITTSLSVAGTCNAPAVDREYTVQPFFNFTPPASCRMRVWYYFGPNSGDPPDQSQWASVGDFGTQTITMQFYGSSGTAPDHTDLGNYYFRAYLELYGTDAATLCDTSETDTVGPTSTWICG